MIDALPSHWDTRRLRYLLRERDARSKSGTEPLLRVSQYTGVTERAATHDARETGSRAQSLVGYKLVESDDLVVNIMLAWNGSLGVSRYRGITSPAYCVYRFGPGVSPWYFHYLLRSEVYKARIKMLSTGVVESRLRLYTNDLFQLEVPVPPIADQRSIVRFLDRVDLRFRQAIRAKQKLIALLNEQKQAIVYGVVIRGLDPSAPLAPSGVEWFGHVPAHWEVSPLRRRWTVTDCKHLTVPFVDEGIPLASVREAQTFDLSLAGAKRTTRQWYDLLVEGGRRPRKGDLIYCRNMSVGAAAIVTTDEEFAMGQDVCLIRSLDQNQRFLNYFLHSPAMERQLASLLIGSTFNRINVSEIKALTVVVPPRSEQDAIAAHLDRVLASTDEAVESVDRQIELLREYRKRLIADVVTGKLDVREAAARLPDAVDDPEPLDELDLEGADEPELDDLDLVEA